MSTTTTMQPNLNDRVLPSLPEPNPMDTSGPVPITPDCLAAPMPGNPLGPDPRRPPGSPR